MNNKLIFNLLFIFYSELLSFLALQFLNLPNRPLPWSVIFIIFYGFYEVVLASAILALIPFLILGSLYFNDLKRYLSLIILAIISFIILVAILSIIITQELTGNSFGSLYLIRANLLHAQIFKYFLISFLSISTLFLSLIIYKIFNKDKLLGNAHFANSLEIYQGKFFNKEQSSIIIGKKYGLPLFANGYEHVLVFAPSGSGKTRSIATPNLFNFPYSIVCNDVKFTLFETTSGFREKVLGHKCFCFAPARSNGVTHRYNPLSFIPNNKITRIQEIQRIAHILIPDANKENHFWAQTSRNLFKVLTLFLLDSEDYPTTLGQINRLVKQDNFNFWLEQILANTTNFDPEFYRNGYSYLNNEIRTRDNILQSFTGYFELFDDPIIDTATSATDFNIHNLRKEKMTIYIGFSDEDMERLSPILTLFWQQIISAMINSIPNLTEEPYPLLCLLDEFSSLGRIERLRRSLKLLREYRVRVILMFQYIAQTYEKYTKAEAKAFTNIKTKIAYGSEDYDDALFISKLLGVYTKKIFTESNANQSSGTTDTSSFNYQQLPLLRAEEVMQLPIATSLIMTTGYPPIKAQQYIWYQEKNMKNLSLPPIVVPSQKIEQKPFKHNDDQSTFKRIKN